MLESYRTGQDKDKYIALLILNEKDLSKIITILIIYVHSAQYSIYVNTYNLYHNPIIDKDYYPHFIHKDVEAQRNQVI